MRRFMDTLTPAPGFPSRQFTRQVCRAVEPDVRFDKHTISQTDTAERIWNDQKDRNRRGRVLRST